MYTKQYSVSCIGESGKNREDLSRRGRGSKGKCMMGEATESSRRDWVGEEDNLVCRTHQQGSSAGWRVGGQGIRKLEIRGLATNSDSNSSPLSENLSQENKN